HYQIHLQKKGHLDHVTLHVEVCEEFYGKFQDKEDFTHPLATDLTNRIRKTLKMKTLISVDVNLKAPKSIPRSEGKAKRIVDHRT
ncbi:phenylacetate--CoA ligase, partial [Staphylococcus sp. SIMBA_130]